MSLPATERITIPYRESRGWLLANLRYHVFHVTSLDGLRGIEASGAILPNIDNSFPSRFETRPNGFFRKRGCVSVFDLRTATDDQIEQCLHRCFPLRRDYQDDPPVVLVLAPEAYSDLESWEAWNTEEARSDMVLPYLEAGHKGPVPAAQIERVIVVENELTPSPLEVALHKVRR